MATLGNRRCWWAAGALLAAVLCVEGAAMAVADDGQTPQGAAAGGAQPLPPAPQPGATVAPPPPVVTAPGFLHQLGVWWNDGFADFNAKIKNAKDKLEEINKSPATQDALQNAAQATKDAATAVVRLPATRVFELHDRCPVAGNGAPDCQAAATNACRGKGFASGQPLDISTSQDCPARVVMSGQPPVPNECHDDTVILRIVCQ
jgi:hypothetical protein